jgi:hypothetical protein
MQKADSEFWVECACNRMSAKESCCQTRFLVEFLGSYSDGIDRMSVVLEPASISIFSFLAK